MRSELVDKKPVEATVKVTVPAAEVDAEFESVLSSLARTVRIPGFRPGKIPRGVLEKRLGQESLAGEVQEKIIDAHYQAAMKEHDLLPISVHFHAQPPARGSDYSFEVHAELYPEVELPALDELTLEAKPQELDDETVAAAIDQLRRENATLVPVDRPVQADDWLLIETVPAEASTEDAEPSEEVAAAGEDAGAEEAPGPSAETAAEAGGEVDSDDTADSESAGGGSSFPVDLETAGEELRSQLVGASIGDVVNVDLTDEVVKDEEGQPTVRTLRIKINDVKAKEKPEPGEEFATQLGMDSWAAVEQRVRESLAADFARSGFEARRDELVDKLIAGAEFELPPGLVRRRQQSLLEGLVADLKEQGQTLESYVARLDARGQREEFEAELLRSAERGVRRDLVLERLVEVRKTEVSDAELQDAVKHLAAQRRRDIGSFMQEMGPEWLDNYRFMLARDKAVRELIAEITGEPLEADSEQERARAASEAAAVADAMAEDDEHDHDHHHGHDHDHGHNHG